jgi:t-SNARE complex subunit (syntaxin)
LGEFDETVLKARQEEIEALEKDLIDTKVLFKDVSELVQEQGISLDKIEEHADVAQAETGHAVEELERAEVYQKRARGKLCWIIVAVLALCIVVAAVVLGVKFI